MGNANCLSEQGQKLGGTFSDPIQQSQVEMVAVNDPKLEKNLQQNKVHAPQLGTGKKMDKRPKLSQTVESSLQRQLQSRSLSKATSNGIALPVYYLNKYKAYYEGEWQKGQPNGNGKLYFTNGSYFQGIFQNGEITGADGIYFYPDGSFKRGNVKNGKLEGNGKFVGHGGNFQYDGQWLDDQPHGKGIQKYQDGSMYSGQFIRGKKNDDNATYKWSNGKVYVGPFKNGFMEGHGHLYMQNGKGQYVGQFSRNLKVGHGKMKTQTGQYTGPFENGQMHGTGVFKWNDGKIYEGQFERGQLHGNGVIYYPNGQLAKGVWRFGQNLQLDSIQKGKMQIKA